MSSQLGTRSRSSFPITFRFAVGQEEASSQEILTMVNMSISSTEEFDDEPVVQIERFLRTRLDAHGGAVRLQSRLFAQWLHYAFPRDCAFPPCGRLRQLNEVCQTSR